MKKNVLFALIALFCVSSSAWAQYVKLTAADGTVSWIEIKGKINGTNIELDDGDYVTSTLEKIDGTIPFPIDKMYLRRPDMRGELAAFMPAPDYL